MGLSSTERRRYLRDLSHPDVRRRSFAAFILGGEPASATVVRALRSALRDPAPAVRDFAAQSLGALGDGKSIGAIIEIIGKWPPRLTRGAARGLADLGACYPSHREPVTSALRDYLGRARGRQRDHAAALLAELGVAAEDAS